MWISYCKKAIKIATIALLTLCVVLICLIIAGSFYDRKYTNYELTDITMQRVDIDDDEPVLKGKVFYLLTPTFVGHDWQLGFPFHYSCGPWHSHGSYEEIHDIIISDAKGKRMNDIQFLDSCGGDNINHFRFVDDAEPRIPVDGIKQLGDIMSQLVKGGPGPDRDPFDSYLLYVEEGEPLPDSIAVKFAHSTRMVKAKVNNVARKMTRDRLEDATSWQLKKVYKEHYEFMHSEEAADLPYFGHQLVHKHCTYDFAQAFERLIHIKARFDPLTCGFVDSMIISTLSASKGKGHYEVWFDANVPKVGGGSEVKHIKLAVYMENNLISKVEML